MVAEPPAAKPEDQYEQLWVVGAGGEAPAPPPPRPATEAPAPPTTNKAAPSFVPPHPATVPRDESSTAPVGSDQTSTRKNSKIESREKSNSKKPKKKTEKEEKDETSEMGSDMGSELRSAKKMKKKERHEKKEVEEFTARRHTPKWAVPCFIFCLLVCFVGTGVSIVLAGHQWLGWAMIEAFVV